MHSDTSLRKNVVTAFCSVPPPCVGQIIVGLFFLIYEHLRAPGLGCPACTGRSSVTLAPSALLMLRQSQQALDNIYPYAAPASNGINPGL